MKTSAQSDISVLVAVIAKPESLPSLIGVSAATWAVECRAI